MTVNSPTVAPSVRAPLLRILADGKPLPGAIEASWTQTNHYAPDTWRAAFATGADPRYGPAWWDNRNDPLILDIQVGMRQPGGSVAWTSLGIGRVDSHTLMPDAGEIHIEGRDLSALLIESQTAEAFQNQTASQIVATIAARHSLTADATATTELASRYWQTDHTVNTQHQHAGTANEWDVLVKLARAEGFDLYVTGTTLHFHPVADPRTADPYVLRYRAPAGSVRFPVSNAIDLRETRKFTLAKSATVVVQSFHSRAGKTVTATKMFTGAAPKGGSVNGNVYAQPAKGKGQTFNFVRPNLTQAQADALAQSLLDDIVRHERVISWREPANMVLTARSIVRLDGTGTDFDAAYFAEHVTRTISFDGGWMMEAQAKNHSPAAADATPD